MLVRIWVMHSASTELWLLPLVLLWHLNGILWSADCSVDVLLLMWMLKRRRMVLWKDISGALRPVVGFTFCLDVHDIPFSWISTHHLREDLDVLQESNSNISRDYCLYRNQSTSTSALSVVITFAVEATQFHLLLMVGNDDKVFQIFWLNFIVCLGMIAQ